MIYNISKPNSNTISEPGPSFHFGYQLYISQPIIDYKSPDYNVGVSQPNVLSGKQPARTHRYHTINYMCIPNSLDSTLRLYVARRFRKYANNPVIP